MIQLLFLLTIPFHFLITFVIVTYMAKDLINNEFEINLPFLSGFMWIVAIWILYFAALIRFLK